MPFNRQAEYQAQLDHLISLARDPLWKAYAWRSAKEWEAHESGLFRGLCADLTAAMSKAGPACDPASADQNPTKHP
jgi:hypothetical protein